MIEERKNRASTYQAEGKAIAAAIEGRAQAARDKILALANARAAEIEARGEEAAAQHYAKFREDPDFAVFLRSVEALRKGLKDRGVFVLDSTVMPIISRFWKQPVSANAGVQK